jgi:hypothetical protein
VSPTDEEIGGTRFTGAAFYLTVDERAPSIVAGTVS